ACFPESWPGLGGQTTASTITQSARRRAPPRAISHAQRARAEHRSRQYKPADSALIPIGPSAKPAVGNGERLANSVVTHRVECPPMPIQALFPTHIYSAPLQKGDWRKLNKQLLRECLQLQLDDEAGRKWSKKNYPGGYTSYHSAHRMQ